MSNLFIVAAKRTAFGSFGGSFTKLSATDLAAESAKAALLAGNINPSIVDAVFFGNVAQTSLDGPYLARHAALKAGVPIETPALTINRLCGSGFETLIQGALTLKAGDASVAMCGGSENMSQSPLSVYGHNVRWGTPLGSGLKQEDTLWAALTDTYAKMPMGMTAENLAKLNDISREECDEYALRSQLLWAKAKTDGVFDAEIAPIEVKTKKGMATIDTDEHARPQTKIENLQKLRAVFDKEGVVTAGNASGICDGAGTLILATEEAVKKHGLTPLARLVSYSINGVAPSEMGIGPVPAIKSALSKAGLTLADMDRIEINEAFAAQYLSCEKQLGLDKDKTNINGGAIALGHPLAASGSRIMAHLTHDLHRVGGRYAVGSACIGGGQGIAVVIERV